MSDNDKPYPVYRSRVEYMRAVEALEMENSVFRQKIALIEVTVALWEAGAVEMESEAGRFTEFPRTQSSMWARADTNRAHAEVIREILKGE